MARENRFCAFCGQQRRVYVKAHVSAWDVFLAIGLGLLALSPFAGGLDARGFGLAAVFVGIAELFTVMRHRMSLKCGRCGFDPIIYRRSQEDAAKLVRAHLQRRSEDPRTLLTEPVLPYKRRRNGTLRPDPAPHL
jgi:hypothetical protein